MSKLLRSNFETVTLDYALWDPHTRTLLAVSAIDSSVVRCRSMSARVNGTATIDSNVVNGWGLMKNRMVSTQAMGRDNVSVFLSTSSLIGEVDGNSNYGPEFGYLVTSRESRYTDLYNILMEKLSLPLLTEWMETLLDAMCINGCVRKVEYGIISDDMSRCIELHGAQVPLSEVEIYALKVNDDILSDIVSKLLQQRKILIPNAEHASSLELSGSMDEYFEKYGSVITRNLDRVIKPLVPLDGYTENALMKETRMYPQQSACVNGVVKLLENQSYAFVIEGMGCGKTLQACAIAEASAIGKYRRVHPKAELKDVVAEVSYRNIVMCPSHLVEKWAATIRKEVPYAKVTILKSLTDLIHIRERGKERNGREWYVVSKDTAKLGESVSPVPYHLMLKNPALQYCKTCMDEADRTTWRKPGQVTCPECGGTHWEKRYYPEYRTQGLTCPDCDELLIDFTDKSDPSEGLDEKVLIPADMQRPTKANQFCYHCGSALWAPAVQNLCPPGTTQRKNKWVKISHKPNWTSKSNKTYFVMGNRVQQHLDAHPQVEREDQYKVSPVTGPRKYSLARYIKKHLKGYFDLAVFDEAHLLEGGATAQGIAMHSIVKASKKSIALTGTISNGYASKLFYLFWRLCPEKMKRDGWTWSSELAFARRYGTVETAYQYNGRDDDEELNLSSRGSAKSSPQMKPGISPLLYTDYLLGSCVQLDLADMSSHLPELTEYIVPVEMEEDVHGSYRSQCMELAKAARTEEGRGILGKMLNFSLFYPDKPYGWDTIYSPFEKDKKILQPSDFSKYEDQLLNKEQELVRIVNKEQEEGRNIFVFAECSGDTKAYILGRLQHVIEKYCGLDGKVVIMESKTETAVKREAWIHKTAQKKGAKVFICNPRLVETGLDLLWTDEETGRSYNYPTLIFYQMGYQLSTLWQASRRAYRLNQTVPCRNYYLAYDNTMQMDVVELMARKQVAVSAIQGKFSADGLASMAKGVDSRVLLAQRMKDGAGSVDKNTLAGMFDVMNAGRNAEDGTYNGFKKNLLFREVCTEICVAGQEEQPAEDLLSVLDTFSIFDDDFGFDSDDSSLGDDFFAGISLGEEEALVPVSTAPESHSKKKKKSVEGQMSFEDFIA